jgi:hypothetical protein
MERRINGSQQSHLDDGAVRPEQATPVAGERNRFGLDRSVLTRRTGLCLPPQLSLEGWRRIGRQMFIISDSSAWWWGDWLVFGEERYPDRYKRAIAETSLDYQTLRNYAWVARRFPMSRRRDRLSFQHHVVVAALPDAEQDALLSQAEEHGWSRKELRRRLRQAQHPARSELEEAVVYQLSVDPDRQKRWQEAAGHANEQVVDWIVRCVDHAADALLGHTGEAAASRPGLSAVPLRADREQA